MKPQPEPRSTAAIVRPSEVRVAVSPVVALAILQVNSDRLGLDLIEQFVPFVADALRQECPDAISANDLQRSVQELFGLTMPIGALKVVLSRCAKRDLVTQKNGVYRPNRAALASQPNLQAERAGILRQHQALLDKFRLHTASVLGVDLTGEVANAALTRYIALRAAPLLATAVDGAPIIPMDAHAADGEQLLLVEAFVLSLYESDPDGFRYLSTIVKGSVLASVLYLKGDIGDAGRTFKDIVFYIDAPLLARALGFCTPEQALGSRELLELLQAEGAQLACFTHNLEEINGILDRAHRDVADPRRHRQAVGETVRFFLDAGVGPSDIVEKQRTLRQDLEAMGVVIRDKPPTTRDNSVDEFALEDELAGVHYTSDEARDVDVASLTAIWRLRKARKVWRLEEAGAVFVTANTGLVAGARAFFSREQGGPIPLVIRDDVLATLAWLKKPGVKPDLPVSMVIADCFAALRPPEGAWPEYLKKIKALEERGQITPPEVALLCHDLQVRALVIRQSKKSGEAFTEGNVLEVLDVARANIAADKDLQAREAEVARLAAEQAAARAAEDAAAARQEKEDAERDLAGERTGRDTDFDRAASRIANVALNIGSWVALLVILGYQVLAAPRPLGRSLPETLPGSLHLGATVLLAVGLVLSNGSAFGLNDRFGRARLHAWVSTRIASVLRRARDAE